MIKIFYGDGRTKISAEIEKVLGSDYEVKEVENIELADLPSIFLGTSLFGEKRNILLKELGEKKEIFAKLLDYLETPHNIVIWETKLDKRTATYKDLIKKAKKYDVEIKEFKADELNDNRMVFEIYDTALTDGKKAVKMVEQIELIQDPYMFLGLMISQALKKYEWRMGAKEKRVLIELSKLDMQTKTTAFDVWTLIKAFLLRLNKI